MNKITSIYFEEASKGNKIDYGTIRARMEQEEKKLPVDKIGKEKSDSDDKNSSAIESRTQKRMCQIYWIKPCLLVILERFVYS